VVLKVGISSSNLTYPWQFFAPKFRRMNVSYFKIDPITVEERKAKSCSSALSQAFSKT